MKIFIVVISLGLASARFMVSEEVLHVIYGDIGRMRDLHVPSENEPWETGLPAEHARRSMPDHEVMMPTFHEFFNELGDTTTQVTLNNSLDFDIKDFNEALKKLTNVKKSVKEFMKEEMTRRQFKTREFSTPPSEIDPLYAHPQQLREWYYGKLCLTYIIHIRFQVDAAIRYKMASVHFRGYKIGYLFHRLKSIEMMMSRIYAEQKNLRANRQLQNRPNWRTKKHSLALILEWYQRMLSLDVDSKDTIELIRKLYFGRDMFQTATVSTTTAIPYK